MTKKQTNHAWYV